MGTHRQRFLHDFATWVTFLRGEARVDSNDCVPRSFSLVTQDIEKRAPGSVHDTFCQRRQVDHGENAQILNSNDMRRFRIQLRCLEMEVSSLPRDLEMGLRPATSGFSSAMTAFFAPRYGSLFAPECSLRCAIKTRVFNRVPITIGQKRCQPNVDAKSRMGAVNWLVLATWLIHTHNQSLPVTSSAQDEMDRFRECLYRAMPCDFEEVSQLLRHDKVLLVFV